MIKDKYEQINVLIREGINLNACNFNNDGWYGLSVIHLLAIEDMSQEILLLVMKGADKNNESIDFLTPMELSIYNGSTKAIRILIHLKARLPKYPIIKAVMSDLPTYVLDLFIEIGADINELDENGKNALYYAKQNGLWWTKRALLERGGVKVKETRKEYFYRKLGEFQEFILSRPF